MNREAVGSLATSFANRYNYHFQIDVDGAYDAFMGAFSKNESQICTLANSIPLRIAVLSNSDEFNGDNLTLQAKLNSDVDTCPIMNAFLEQITKTLATDLGANVTDMRRAIDNTLDDYWEAMIEIVHTEIAKQVVYHTLKQELMIPDA